MHFSACSSAALAAVGVVAGQGVPAVGQVVGASASSPAEAERFDPGAVTAEVRRIVGQEYVLPERRGALDAVLAEGLSSGRYNVREPGLFAERLNADLARVGRDHHLNFRYDPARVAVATAQTADSRPDPTLLEKEVRRRNHGVRELKVLPGNVRYLDLAGFDWIGAESEETLNAAMAFLKGGDAVIIDLRRNGGGTGRAVHQVISQFLEPDRPLITFHKGAESSPLMRSLPGLSTMIGKPLYVLTSRGTGSAAEEFVGHVAGYRLGEVVGEVTSGAAFMNAIFPVAGGFELSVSVARPVLAATGKDWERTGIAPTVAVPAEAALEAAHIHAVRTLAAGVEASRRKMLEGLAEGLEAARRPGAPSAALVAYSGTYGDRRVIVAGARLWYQQEERPRRLMVPTGGHRFTLADEPSLRLDFQVSGARASALDIATAGGPLLGRYERAG